MIFLLYHFIGYFIFLRKIKLQKTVIDSQRILEIYSRLCSEIDSPMLVGLFHTMILLPAQEYSDSELKMILRHELVHARRHDIWYKLLLMFANIVHWFNPIVYIAANRAVTDLEIACDEEVLKNTVFEYRKEYGETMLNVMRQNLKRQTSLSTQFSSNKKAMKQRFMRILDTSYKRRGIVVLCTLALLIGTAGTLVSCKNSNKFCEGASI